MQCFDCGKSGKNLIEYVDGRKTVYLCSLCKAEREWRENPKVLLSDMKKEKPPGIWEKIKNFFKR
ncbi:MAG: hypothetical protein ACLFQV_13405 [Vulcanimicrobiota bacterium]